MDKKSLAVVKFGGTSVATKVGRARAIGHIRQLYQQGPDVVVVVSAMGRKGQPYATDTLLGLVDPDCEKETRDLLMSCGETISACVMADQLTKAGIPARSMTGSQAGLRTDGVFGSAQVTGMDPKPVRMLLANGVVPVITGFQGAGPDGRITTLGRGGSDTSAVEIGGYLGASQVIIYTDVPGIAAADPRLWPQAPYLSEIDYTDILSLASWGAKVVHPRAVKAGWDHQVPVWVRSTFDDEPGTVIRTLDKQATGLLGVAVLQDCAVVKDGGDAETLSLGEAGYAAPGKGNTAVITVLFRPLPAEITGFLQGLPANTQAVRDQELLHLLVPDNDVPIVLPALCEHLSASYK